MGSQARKVKPSATKRVRMTLEKTVTYRMLTVVELEVEIKTDSGERCRSLRQAARRQLEAEQRQGIERQWLTEKVDENSEFSVVWGSIQEIAPHISLIKANEPK
jgi:hypothetical protein